MDGFFFLCLDGRNHSSWEVPWTQSLQEPNYILKTKQINKMPQPARAGLRL